MADVYNPRQEISHDITDGQVYADERHDGKVLYRTLFVDEHYVLLRSNKQRRREDMPLYRGEYRDTFEDMVGSDRLTLAEDADSPPRMPTDLTPVLAVVTRLKDHYERTGGRKDLHKAEAMADLLGELESLEAQEVDWTQANGVGQKAADNLVEAGYATDTAVLHAPDADLLDVPLIGKKNLQNLRDLAESV